MLAVDTRHQFPLPTPRTGGQTFTTHFRDIFQQGPTGAAHFEPSPSITFYQQHRAPLDLPPHLSYPLFGGLFRHIAPFLPNCRLQMPRAPPPQIESRTVHRHSPVNPTTMAAEAAAIRVAPVSSPSSWEPQPDNVQSTKTLCSSGEDHAAPPDHPGFRQPRRHRRRNIREPARSPPSSHHQQQAKTASVRVIQTSISPEPNARTSPPVVFPGGNQPRSDPPPQGHMSPYFVDPTYSLHVAVECHRATQQDTDGDTPLHIAISQADEVDASLIRHLIHLVSMSGRSIDIFNYIQQTPLHIAVITDHPGITHLLLDAGANPNEPDRNGQTAIHHACKNNSMVCLQTILDKSKYTVDMNARNYNGFAPIHTTVMDNNLPLTNALIASGASIEVQDAKNGWTPLFHAVVNQHHDMIIKLIEIGAMVNAQSYSGNTALHVATGRGYTDSVRLLMRFGADMSLRNTHRDTPAMIASNNQISSILRDSGSGSVGPPVPWRRSTIRPSSPPIINIPTVPRRRPITASHRLPESIPSLPCPSGRNHSSHPLSFVSHQHEHRGFADEMEMERISRNSPITYSRPSSNGTDQDRSSPETLVIDDTQGNEVAGNVQTPPSSCRISVIVQPPPKKRRHQAVENKKEGNTIHQKMPLVTRMLQQDGVLARAVKPEFLLKELPYARTNGMDKKFASTPPKDSGVATQDDGRQCERHLSRTASPMELDGELEIHAPSPESFSESDELDDQVESSSCTPGSSGEAQNGVEHVVDDVPASPSRIRQVSVANSEVESPRCEDSTSRECLTDDSSNEVDSSRCGDISLSSESSEEAVPDGRRNSRDSTPKRRHSDDNDVHVESRRHTVEDNVHKSKRVKEDVETTAEI